MTSNSNGKTVHCPTDATDEAIAAIACAEWWNRTAGGTKHNSYLKFSIVGHSDGPVMAHFTKSNETDFFRVSLMRTVFVANVAQPENPYA